MSKRIMWVALTISWLLTAASLAFVVHLRAQNHEQSEQIRRLEAASNILAIGKSARIYSYRLSIDVKLETQAIRMRMPTRQKAHVAAIEN